MLLLYPPYWLVFLSPIGWAFTLYFALHLIWAGWGVCGLARRGLCLSPGAALLAALAFALSAKMVAHLGGGHIDVVAAVAWLPWLWWAVDRMARRPAWLAAVGTAIAVAAQTLTHLPTLWLSVWVVGGWWLYVRLADRGPGALRRWLRSALAAAGAAVLALGLAAAQLWPLMELLPFTTRSAMTLTEAGRYALPVPLLIGLLFPTALAFPEWVVYPGVVALALAPAGGLARRSVRGRGFLVTLWLRWERFFLSLGQATPLYPAFFRVLPGMAWLRVPAGRYSALRGIVGESRSPGDQTARFQRLKSPLWALRQVSACADTSSRRTTLRSAQADRWPQAQKGDFSQRPAHYSTLTPIFLVQLAMALLAGAGWDGIRGAKPSPVLVSWWALLALLVVIGAAWTQWLPGVVMMPVGGSAVAIGALMVLVMRSRVRLFWRYAFALAVLQARGPTEVAVLDAPHTWPAGGTYRPGRVVRWTPNRIEVEGEGPGWLVVSQVWAPGWRASVDGERAQVYRTDVAFCGLALSAGSHAVVLEYAPTGWLWGRWVSLVAVLVVIVIAAVTAQARWRDARVGHTSQDAAFGL